VLDCLCILIGRTWIDGIIKLDDITVVAATVRCICLTRSAPSEVTQAMAPCMRHTYSMDADARAYSRGICFHQGGTKLTDLARGVIYNIYNI
jgi:hypothetical protein